ncbi:MAG TPA: hypothetical protein VN577_00810 [Terriglobales bacterium]|nr:hypothetical protein [Terriglobales bacterium]
MIRRLGYRRLLPVAQLTLYFALLGIGYFQLPPQALAQEHRTFTPVSPSNIPTAWKVAVALNVPAMVCGALLTSILYPHGTELFVLLFSAPFVALLWHFIGRWLDYQFHILPRPPKTTTRIILAVNGLIIGTFGIISGFVSVPDTRSSEPTGPVVMTLIWSALLIIMCATALFRSRNHRSRASYPTQRPACH